LVTADWKLKISDFGIAFLFTNKHKQNTKSGTIEITAPEVLQNSSYTFQSDVYSFGICMYELLFERDLYPGMTIYDITQKVVHNDLRPTLPTQKEIQEMFFGDKLEFNIVHNYLTGLITRCWSKKPHHRPDWDEICGILSKCVSQLSVGTEAKSSHTAEPITNEEGKKESMEYAIQTMPIPLHNSSSKTSPSSNKGRSHRVSNPMNWIANNSYTYTSADEDAPRSLESSQGYYSAEEK